MADIISQAVSAARPGVSVVIPAYRSERSLPPLIERLLPVLDRSGRACEVILVNDGSPDATWRVIERLAERYPQVRGIGLMRNYGQHSALLCGIRAALHNVVVTIDDDLQHPPEEIPRLLAALDEGWDVVYGAPQREQHAFGRDLMSRTTKLMLQRAMGAEAASKVSAFRAFRRELRQAFATYSGPYVSIDVMLTWATSSFTAVTVRHEPRRHGRSNYNLVKLATHALDMVTGFSTVPLRLASLTGFVATFFGLALLAYVLGRYVLQGGSVPGFPFLASTIAILAGAQLFALGIIGEYLARVHLRVMDRPSYVVRQSTLRPSAESANEALPDAQRARRGASAPAR